MIKWFSDWLTYSILGLSSDSLMGSAVNFFVYDSIKIIFLLYVMVFAIGVVRTFISQDKVKDWMAGKNRLVTYFAASGFGALTPFCSCSSIPIFISFIRAGIPLGAAFAFLVTSPLLNEYLAILMLSFFGWKITVAYILFGLALGITAGFLSDAFNWEKHLVEDIVAEEGKQGAKEIKGMGSRISYGVNEASSIVKKLWIWVLVGVGVGAFIHGFVPEEWIHKVINSTGILSVPLATIVGIPIYANCIAVVPIAVVLFQKGVPLGTALAFMMATASLSLPEAVILRRAMKIRLILLFFGIVGAGIVFIGYVFNVLETLL
ncbi:MAG: permease [Candidatus Altiarchaeota archaeon]